MADFTNDFSWSMSRAAKLNDCPRAYYFHYYASWGGWEAGAPPEIKTLWRLKKLTSRKAWAGTEVHDTIAWALDRVRRGAELPDVGAAVGRMHERMRQGFKESREGAWQRRKALGLVEHAYDEPIDDTEWADNWAHARRCLEFFYEAQVLEDILDAGPDHWFPIDALDTFDFEGTKIYVAPDFAFRTGEGTVRLLDWKTGKPRDKDRSQVRGYTLFAEDKWDVDPATVRAELHYLGQGEVVEVPVAPEDLDAFRAEMRGSIETMQAGLVDVAGNVADPDAFPPVAEPRACSRCNFRGACPDAALG